VHADNSPCFIIEVPQAPCEIIMEVSQSCLRFQESDAHDEALSGRHIQAPLLLRFFQCSQEVTELSGGEIYLVHLSAWTHSRDASTAVKVMTPGRYMAMVSMPASFCSNRMIFRTYSTFPTFMKPVLNHRSFVCVNPAQPLNAIPYSMAGFMRIDSPKERVPQNFDESEGRGVPMSNPAYERRRMFFFMRGPGPKGEHQWGHLAHGEEEEEEEGSDSELEEKGEEDMEVMQGMYGGYGGMRVVGKFGGADAIATVDAKEEQCVTM